MSLNLIIMALGGGSVIMPPSINIYRFDTGAPAEFHLNSDGYRYRLIGSSLDGQTPWASPLSSAGLYEVRSTVTSGSFQTDPSAGAWLSLSSTRIWSRGAAISGVQTVVATIEIRVAATLSVISTSTLTLTCDRT